MDRSEVIELVSISYGKDAIGQKIPIECKREVFCQLGSVTRAEFFDAGRSGLNAQFRATVFAPDYQGEEIAIVRGHRYGIYRTYIGKNETLELYMEKKAGV